MGKIVNVPENMILNPLPLVAATEPGLRPGLGRNCTGCKKRGEDPVAP